MQRHIADSSLVGQLNDSSNLEWKKRRSTIEASWGDTLIECDDNLFEALLKLDYTTEEGQLVLKSQICILQKLEKIEGILTQLKKKGEDK